MPTKDPRSYVQCVPLPIPSHKGLKLQARCEKVYNPTNPSRDVVRKINFRRRQEQLTAQGFNAFNYKPYVGIGDPFYLDEKRMVLSALGQLDESDDSYYTSSSDEDDLQRSELATPHKSMTAAKFMLRRKKRDLNNLNKEVKHGRNMIRNVKLGHGLFDLIKQDRSAKKAAIAEVYRKKSEEARNAWQAPKSDSSDDDSEPDIPQEVEFDSNYYSGAETEIFLTQQSELETRTSSGEGGSRPNSSKSTPRKKKKNIPPRPFTPKYTSLSEVTDHTTDFESNLTSSLAPSRDVSPDNKSIVPINPDEVKVDNTVISFDVSRDSLFRQLCVLNWILEAMNLEHGYCMGPITTCWKLTKHDMGGSKVSSKKLQKEKTDQTRWDQFVTNTGPHSRMSKRSSGPRLSRQYTRRVHLTRAPLSPSNSTSQLSVNNLPTAASHSLHPPGGTLNEDSAMTPVHEVEEKEEETAYSRTGSTGIFKFLDEYYASLKLPDEGDPDNIDIYNKRSVNSDNLDVYKQEKRASTSEGRKSRKSHRKKSSDRYSAKHDRRDSRAQSAKTISTLEDRRPSRVSISHTKLIRPKSSPGLIEYQATLPSNKYHSLSTDLRSKFEEIQEDSALTLHDILQKQDRDRLSKCQSKFAAMRARSSMWQSLDRMREGGSSRNQMTEMMGKKSSFRGNWFTDLQESIPKQLTNLWYYRQILQKLCHFGLSENSSRQSPYPFIKALGTLREWEICSPDITAAIEFCREKIVDMTVEEFEEWFQQQFPSVTRPPTGAPTPKPKEQKDQLTRAALPSSQSSRPTTTATNTTGSRSTGMKSAD